MSFLVIYVHAWVCPCCDFGAIEFWLISLVLCWRRLWLNIDLQEICYIFSLVLFSRLNLLMFVAIGWQILLFWLCFFFFCDLHEKILLLHNVVKAK